MMMTAIEDCKQWWLHHATPCAGCHMCSLLSYIVQVSSSQGQPARQAMTPSAAAWQQQQQQRGQLQVLSKICSSTNRCSSFHPKKCSYQHHLMLLMLVVAALLLLLLLLLQLTNWEAACPAQSRSTYTSPTLQLRLLQR
jgi:hypothetical protein